MSALIVIQRGFLDAGGRAKPNQKSKQPKKWKRRYFVAVKGFLLVFNSQPDPKKSSAPKAKLDLASSTTTSFTGSKAGSSSSASGSPYPDRPHVLAIRDRSGTEHVFSAGNAQELELWVKTLNRAADPNFDPKKLSVEKRGVVAHSHQSSRSSRADSSGNGSNSRQGQAASVQGGSSRPASERADVATGITSGSSAREGQLPPGWEAAKDSRGRTYYIDHNSRLTTYRSPLKSGPGGSAMPAVTGRSGTPHANQSHLSSKQKVRNSSASAPPADSGVRSSHSPRTSALPRSSHHDKLPSFDALSMALASPDPSAPRANGPRASAPPLNVAPASAPPTNVPHSSAPPASVPRSSAPPASVPRSSAPPASASRSSASASRVRPDLRRMTREEILRDFEIDPLPDFFELKFTGKGRPYFVDHSTRKTSFERPPPVSVVISHPPRRETALVVGRTPTNPTAPPVDPSAGSIPLFGGAAEGFDADELARIQERMAMLPTTASAPVSSSDAGSIADEPARASQDAFAARPAAKAGSASDGGMLGKLAAEAGNARSGLRKVSAQVTPAPLSDDEDDISSASEDDERGVPTYLDHVSRHGTIKLNPKTAAALKGAMQAGQSKDSVSASGETFSSSSSSSSSEAEESSGEFDTDDEQEMAAEIKARKLEVIKLKRAGDKNAAIALLQEVREQEEQLADLCTQREKRRAAALLAEVGISDDDLSESDAEADEDGSPVPGLSSDAQDESNSSSSEEDDKDGVMHLNDKNTTGATTRAPAVKDPRLSGLAAFGGAAISAIRKPSAPAPKPPLEESTSISNQATSSPDCSDSSGDDVPDFADSDSDAASPTEPPPIPSAAPPTDKLTFTAADITRMKAEMEAKLRAEMEAELAAERERLRAELAAKS